MNNELYHSNIIINSCYDYELYHYGIPGMKWGRRKQIIRTARSSLGSGASRVDKKAAVERALAADNAARIKKYGANKVKRSNRLRNVGTAVGAAAVVGALARLSKSNFGGTKGIVQSSIKVAAGAAALGVTIRSAKKINARHQDNKMVNKNTRK